METAEQRAEYVEGMLEALCSEPGPHPSGTRAYEQVALRIHADLESVLPDAFLDRYLDFWHVLPRPEIIYKGKQVAVDVAENCAGTSPEGFTGMIERIDGPVLYRIVDVATGETAACITVGKDVHAELESIGGALDLPPPRIVLSPHQAIFFAAGYRKGQRVARSGARKGVRQHHCDDRRRHIVVGAFGHNDRIGVRHHQNLVVALARYCSDDIVSGHLRCIDHSEPHLHLCALGDQ